MEGVGVFERCVDRILGGVGGGIGMIDYENLNGLVSGNVTAINDSSSSNMMVGIETTTMMNGSVVLDDTTNDSFQMERVMYCISDELETVQRMNEENFTWWLITLAGAMVSFMQAGFAMVCAGAVRKKNVQNTMLKNLLDACGAAIAFFCFGFAFAYGGDFNTNGGGATTTFIGTENFFSLGLAPSNNNDDNDDSTSSLLSSSSYTGGFAFWFYQYAFSAAAVTIVAGTLAERCQMIAYVCYSLFLSGMVYPVIAHAVWSSHGMLSTGNANPLLGIGMIDFAGSGVVHLTGGLVAYYATYILGSRRGRFFDVTTGEPLVTPKEFPGHSVPLQMLGTMILWFGWYGFNGGSALLLSLSEEQSNGAIAAHVIVNTTLGAASGALSGLLVTLLYTKYATGGDVIKFDIINTMNGALSGLVSITAGCGAMEHWSCVLTGCIGGGLIYVFGSKFLIRMKIDDAVDAIPVHMLNGLWGILAVGLFASPDRIMEIYFYDDIVVMNNHNLNLNMNMNMSMNISSFESDETAAAVADLPVRPAGFFYSLDGRLLACQLVGILFIFGWTFFTMVPFFLTLNYFGWFRTESVLELIGLDTHYHNAKTTLLQPLASSAPSNARIKGRGDNHNEHHHRHNDDADGSSTIVGGTSKNRAKTVTIVAHDEDDHNDDHRNDTTATIKNDNNNNDDDNHHHSQPKETETSPEDDNEEEDDDQEDDDEEDDDEDDDEETNKYTIPGIINNNNNNNNNINNNNNNNTDDAIMKESISKTIDYLAQLRATNPMAHQRTDTTTKSTLASSSNPNNNNANNNNNNNSNNHRTYEYYMEKILERRRHQNQHSNQSNSLNNHDSTTTTAEDHTSMYSGNSEGTKTTTTTTQTASDQKQTTTATTTATTTTDDAPTTDTPTTVSFHSMHNFCLSAQNSLRDSLGSNNSSRVMTSHNRLSYENNKDTTTCNNNNNINSNNNNGDDDLLNARLPSLSFQQH